MITTSPPTQEAGNGKNKNSSNATMTTTTSTVNFNQQLLEREREFRQKNKAITKEVTQALQKVETGLKEGGEMLMKGNKTSTMMKKPALLSSASSSVTVTGGSGGGLLPLPEIGKKIIKSHNVTTTNSHAKPTFTTHKKEEEMEDEEEEEVMQGTGGVPSTSLGPQATTRFLKAKLHVLQGELDTLVGERMEREARLAGVEERLRGREEEHGKDLKMIASLETQLERSKKTTEEVQRKLTLSTTELSSLKREVETLNRNGKVWDQEGHAKDLKLNRLQEDLEKLKVSHQAAMTTLTQRLETSKRTAEGLFMETRRLLKQRGELVGGFRRQGELVEVLKKQRMHVEASKILQFSEEEFLRIMNQNS